MAEERDSSEPQIERSTPKVVQPSVDVLASLSPEERAEFARKWGQPSPAQLRAGGTTAIGQRADKPIDR